jgi:hypothetical protein
MLIELAAEIRERNAQEAAASTALGIAAPVAVTPSG